MFNKDIVLKVSKNQVEKIDLDKKKIKTNLQIKYSLLKNIEEYNLKVKNKNVYIVIEDVEIYIKYFKVPKTSKWNLNSIIKNELIFLYGEKAKKIFYTYTLWKDREDELEVIVFCVNCDELDCLEGFIDNNKIRKINLIQFCFLNYFSEGIREKDYIFVFKYNEMTYLLGMSGGILISNKIIKNEEKNSCILKDVFKYTLDKMNSYEIKIHKVYSVNFKNQDFCNYITLDKNYSYTNLGEVSKEKIIEYFLIKRKKI